MYKLIKKQRLILGISLLIEILVLASLVLMMIYLPGFDGHYAVLSIFCGLFIIFNAAFSLAFSILIKETKGKAELTSAEVLGNDMDEASFRRHGFATCLYKPFNQHDLAQAIRKALGHTMEETPQATGRPAALAAGHIDFSPLTAFAGDDREAARRILDTFLQETARHAEAFTRAMREKDKAEACRLAHKMLPAFALIGAPCATSMRLLEQRREEPEWTEADDAPAKEIAAALPLVVRLLQARLS